MLHQHCYNDQRIKTAILNVTNNVQNCFKKEERLKKSNKKIVMKRMFDAVCSMMELCKKNYYILKNLKRLLNNLK